jgi:hypothetical protein
VTRLHTRKVLAALRLAMVLLPAARAQSTDAVRVLDDFEGPDAWSAYPADGVSLDIGRGPGRRGRAMRLDFDFHGHAGYAIARLPLPIDLPENYQFSFWIRGAARPNTLEFKLLDPTGENVWWSTRPAFEFPNAWRRLTIKRRHLAFAWGPAGGGEPRRISAVEIVITAAQGGKGSVWIDDFTLTTRPPERPYTLTPTVTASSAAPGHPAASVLDTAGAGWRAAGGGAGEWIDFDFLRPREFGGLLVEWEPDRHAADYDVQTSPDGRRWTTVYLVRGGNGGRDYIALPEQESRWLRLRLSAAARGGTCAIRSLRIEPIEWSETSNAFFESVARDAPPGSYPRYFSGIQSYWTIVGASGDGRRALLNELGVLEPRLGGWSIEPFLLTSGGLVTWHDGQRRQWLERGDLPIPSVEWRAGDLTLTVTAFAAGPAGAASLLARYRIANTGQERKTPSLALALRPFQVNPPSQWLNTQGGTSRLSSLGFASGVVAVNDTERVVAVTPAGRFGAARFDQGEVVEFLRAGAVPPAPSATDTSGRASGALIYPLTLAPGESRDIVVEIPLAAATRPASPRSGAASASAYGERRLAETVRQWTERLDRVEFRLPPSATDLVATVKANLAYILINRDGPAIEPGARSYRRAWIRDGAMISAALLRLGQADEVRRFLEWYAPYQYPDGKVPCCVDARGADPVPENDSHGQLIYLAMEYYRHTGDRVTLQRMWPHVKLAVAYIDSLRGSRRTPAYERPESLAFRGLLPQSISHEGYSAKPMHSYWDDFFALKGLKDAVDIAAVLGRTVERERFARIRDEFRADLYASIGRAMAAKGIDFIPGSVELGDFDPTSTTVALTPGDELGRLPEAALQRTFGRYWDRFVARRDGSEGWDAYTPYELRTVGTMLRLGWKDRAHQLLSWFFEGRRPAAWRDWAEVVWREPGALKFIGDMPHTWVGSDFLRSTLDFFAYEREADSSLVVGDGLLETWVDEAPGVTVGGLSTHYGRLSYSMRGEGGAVRVRIAEGVRMPPGGLVVRSPRVRPLRAAVLDGATVPVRDGREVVVRRLPADLILSY